MPRQPTDRSPSSLSDFPMPGRGRFQLSRVTQPSPVRHRRDVEGSCSIEEAYRKWSDDLVRYATALVGPADAADLVADTFAGFLHRGETSWAQVRDPRSYAFRSVTNAARMNGRGSDRRRRREARWSVVPTSRGELLGDPSVTAALAALSVRQRAAVFLTYWEDLPVAEVARRLGTSEGSVKRHLARGRAALREVLS
jgi:DNA-directed RNA polymerase specialized sigma24 family protein